MTQPAHYAKGSISLNECVYPTPGIGKQDDIGEATVYPKDSSDDTSMSHDGHVFFDLPGCPDLDFHDPKKRREVSTDDAAGSEFKFRMLFLEPHQLPEPDILLQYTDESCFFLSKLCNLSFELFSAFVCSATQECIDG